MEEWLFHWRIIVGDVVGTRLGQVLEGGRRRIRRALGEHLFHAIGQSCAKLRKHFRQPGENTANTFETLKRTGIARERYAHAIVSPRRFVDDLRVEFEVDEVAVVRQGRRDVKNDAHFAHGEALRLDHGENRALGRTRGAGRTRGTRVQLHIVVGRVDILRHDLDDRLLARTRQHLRRGKEIRVAALREHVEDHREIGAAQEGVHLHEAVVRRLAFTRNVVAFRREITVAVRVVRSAAKGIDADIALRAVRRIAGPPCRRPARRAAVDEIARYFFADIGQC